MNSFIKFFAVLGCVCIAQSGFAQFQKGSILLGGAIYFYSDNNNNPNNNNTGQTDLSNGSIIGVFPNVGYTFKDNWVAFFETGYRNNAQTKVSYQTQFPSTKDTYTTNGYNIPINIGIKRFWQMGNKFSFGLGSSASLSIGNETTIGEYTSPLYTTQSTSTSKSLTWGLGVSPSINYVLGDKLNLSLSVGSLGYSRSESKQTYERQGSTDVQFSDYNRGNFFSSLSLNNIQIGAYYIIQPKTKKAE
jgi:hypothetical protein